MLVRSHCCVGCWLSHPIDFGLFGVTYFPRESAEVHFCEALHSAMQDVYQPRGEFRSTKVAMTIHNIAFQVGGN